VPYPDVALWVTSACGAKNGKTSKATWPVGLQALKPRKDLKKDLLLPLNSSNVSKPGILTNNFTQDLVKRPFMNVSNNALAVLR
jgi:hypothetical protein